MVRALDDAECAPRDGPQEPHEQYGRGRPRGGLGEPCVTEQEERADGCPRDQQAHDANDRGPVYHRGHLGERDAGARTRIAASRCSTRAEGARKGGTECKNRVKSPSRQPTRATRW
jgi:hypothetical protein